MPVRPGEARSVTIHPWHVLIIHEVDDYPAWKRVFDGAAGIRKQAGKRSFQVLSYEEDANRIVHFSRWTSTADARQFFESDELVRIREEAGVRAPEFVSTSKSWIPGRSSQDLGPTNRSSLATLSRWEIEMFRQLDWLQRIPN